MLIRVFHPTGCLVLTDEPAQADELQAAGYGACMSPTTPDEIRSLFKKLPGQGHMVLRCASLADLLDEISKQVRLIHAAGGLVMAPGKQLLFIYRRGKWDLPKGKMEPEEDQESCAAREIEEETGIVPGPALRRITDTWHWYEEKGEPVLKISHWFFFRVDVAGESKPQLEEDITEVRWFEPASWPIPLADTYPTIVEVVEQAISLYGW